MHFAVIVRFVAILVLFLGLSLTGPLIVSLVYKDGSTGPLIFSIVITALSGFMGFLATQKSKGFHLSHRDGVAVVTLGWIFAGLFGTFPYLFSGVIPGFTNAYFESMSGFTTTGASILNQIEGLPESILLWRAMTQWFGGMGIIVLSIAILPFLGIGGMQLYRAETPSPVVDKLKPRISETAKTLWKVYISITVVEAALLYAGGMPVFDAFCHAFCTLPTGGFSTKTASMAHYNKVYFDVVFIFFMLAAGINFSLHYRLIKGDLKVFGRDAECRVFLVLVGALVLAVGLSLFGPVYSSPLEAIRYAAFQVVSIITTSGFVTADYNTWPAFSRHILLGCMFLGAMAGSTGGGMKMMRAMLLVKHGFKEVFRITHPHAVTSVKQNGNPVPPEIMSSIWGFFILYAGIFIAATLFMSALGLDMITSLASVAASLGNIGPGLGEVGPAKNYFFIPGAGKWVLIFCMLLGRLEIYTVIVLLTPEFWRK